MAVVVYITALAESRCREEINRAFIAGEIYGDWRAEARIREKAMKRLAPYKKIWQSSQTPGYTNDPETK